MEQKKVNWNKKKQHTLWPEQWRRAIELCGARAGAGVRGRVDGAPGWRGRLRAGAGGRCGREARAGAGGAGPGPVCGQHSACVQRGRAAWRGVQHPPGAGGDRDAAGRTSSLFSLSLFPIPPWLRCRVVSAPGPRCSRTVRGPGDWWSSTPSLPGFRLPTRARNLRNEICETTRT